MSFHFTMNYRDLSKALDFISWDNYPVFGAPEILYNSAAAADLVRGFKRQNFWVMEQTAGPGGWGMFGRNPRPGEIRLISYQQLAHGCDGLLWFRWRSCTAGREQYWHGLLGHDGKPLRRYQEAAQTAQEFHKLWPEIEGTTVKAPVAIIHDYDSMWATESQPSFEGNAYLQPHLRRYYDALFRAGVNVDIVDPSVDLTGYAVVIAPQLHVLPDALARRLDEYVQRGGVLVADIRTGVKTETNLCHDRTLPGLLSAALGISIEEYEALTHAWGASGKCEYTVTGRNGIAGAYVVSSYVDWIKPTGAEVLAGYEAPWHMTDFAAVTRHRYKQGWGYYVGTVVKEPAFYDQLIGDVLKKAKVTGHLNPPVGVEVSVREGNGKKLLFVLNQTEEEQTVTIPAGKPELVTGKITTATIALPRFGVAVIKLQ
ncbi:MAG: beta-galactosidase trimerization domain-containing protein, partial [Verrucomicrobiota bacterium]